MMKRFSRKPAFVLLSLSLAILPFFSCAARINGSLSADGSAVLSVNMSIEPQMTALLRRVASIGGTATGTVLDGPAIAKSMSDASSGNVSATLRNTAPAAVEGQVRISAIGKFLSSADGRRFINFEQGRSGGKCVFNIDRGNGSEMLELLSPQIEDLLNALMAPLATGEAMSKNEYLELVSSFYSRTISDEIASSKIRASIDFPGIVTGVKGGTFSGKKATFEIPLLDLLVLETPLIYEVSWN